MNNGTHRLAGARAHILAHWLIDSDSELAYSLNTTVDNIRHRRRRLGLVRDSENQKAMHDKGSNKRGWTRAPKWW
jgi:hypothetical protein